jgi:RHS repeat-associated protein
MKYGMIRIIATFILAFLSLSAQGVEQVVYYHNDALGSPIAATDQQGRLLWRESYAPYGQRLLKQNGEQDQLYYTGKPEEAALGIQNFGARWYDPRIGRFLAVDPAGFDPHNPQSFNRYAYANNNPYRYVDPNGESPVEVVAELAPAAGQAFGALAAYGIGIVAGDDALVQTAIEGMREQAVDNAIAVVSTINPIPGGAKAARGIVVTGENMKRVDMYAAKVGADTFKGEGMEANRAWIRRARADGKQVVDIGPDFKRRAERLDRGSIPYSRFYNMERTETNGYEGYD